MPFRRILVWTALALAGLLVAVGVTTAATTLTSQRVGLQDEPLDAGAALAPRVRATATATPKPKARPRRRAKPKPTATAAPTADPTPAATTEPAIEPGDDSGGHGRNRGSGGGDD
jgi:hypothetical protein